MDMLVKLFSVYLIFVQVLFLCSQLSWQVCLLYSSNSKFAFLLLLTVI